MPNSQLRELKPLIVVCSLTIATAALPPAAPFTSIVPARSAERKPGVGWRFAETPAKNANSLPRSAGKSVTALEATAEMVAAANAFLATLDAESRAKAVFPFSDASQRTKWSNLPTGIFQRAGLRLGSLNPAQRDAALAVLAAMLSPQGYQKTREIMTADQVLKDQGGNPPGLLFGADEFYLSFLGSPSVSQPWMLQFGGHHLALNFTIAGTNGVLTPSLTATQPATYTLNGKTIRPLGAENDAAFKLVNSLSTEQKAEAILGSQFRDLVLGPGKDGVTIVPEGIKGSELNPEQQTLVLELVSHWVGLGTEAAAAAKMKEIQAHLADTYFAWSGPTTPGGAAYFRVQGPTVMIEYAPQNLGGSPVNHIHTIYRDPTNDYGRKFTGL